jgi:hypothetical protein
MPIIYAAKQIILIENISFPRYNEGKILVALMHNCCWVAPKFHFYTTTSFYCIVEWFSAVLLSQL